MKMRVAVLVVAAVLAWSASATAQPLGTAFTYQGRLTDASNPASGIYDFEFIVTDAAAGGSQVGSLVARDDVSVTDGLFTVTLDFGPLFTGARRWLEVSVRPGSSTGAYTTLAPRQELTPSPNAAFSLTTPWSGVSNKPAGFADDVDNDSGGDITGVTAGTGLTGGGASGPVTLAVDLAGSGFAATVAHSDHDHVGQSWAGAVAGTGLTVSNSAGTAISGQMSAFAGPDNLAGVHGLTNSTSTGSAGVRGEATAATGNIVGVHGRVLAGGVGVYGQATSSATAAIGVMGEVNSSVGWAGYFANFSGGPALVTSGRVGVGTTTPSATAMLDVNGVVRSATGGFAFPDGTTQATAASNPAADITAVTAGSGLTGGGTSGAVTISTDPTATQTRVLGGCTPGNSIRVVNQDGTVACETDDNSGGDITDVTASTGLTGGGTTGAVSLAVNFGGTGAATTVSRTDHDHFTSSWTGTVSGPGLSVANTFATQNGADNVSGVRGTGVYGVLGESASTAGRGVVGRNNSISGVGFGVFGQSSSSIGRGVYGLASGFAGVNYGVYGETNSTSGYAGYFAGRVGISSGTAPQGDLQIGQAADFAAMRFGNASARHHLISNRDMVFNGFDLDGVLLGNPLFYWRRNSIQFDENSATTTLMTLGETGNLTVMGNAAVLGLLSKGAGSFKIDHPLDPEHKYLYHSFVESPDMKNIYDGVVTTDAEGFATVELPDWFGALNRDFRYQLTVIDDGDAWVMAKVVREVRDNRFVLRTSVPATKVSWQVTGIRQDAFAEKHRIPVEEDKPEAERGKYLHPLEHGQAADKRIE